MNWDDFNRFVALVKYHKWKFASTMPKHPHFYSLRKKWNNDDGFDFAVRFIREYGYTYKFYGRNYTRFDLDEYSYWTMGDPVDETTLINRALTGDRTPYDKISNTYDSLFVSDESKMENETIFELIGDVSNKSVFDIGCGTGFFLDYKKPKTYTGIDASKGMLTIMKEKHPSANVTHTKLKSYSGGKFDLGIALFGTASYLTPFELLRLHDMCDRVFLMFYKDGYEPETYIKTGISAKPRRYNLDNQPVKNVGNFSILDRRK